MKSWWLEPKIGHLRTFMHVCVQMEAYEYGTRETTFNKPDEILKERDRLGRVEVEKTWKHLGLLRGSLAAGFPRQAKSSDEALQKCTGGCTGAPIGRLTPLTPLIHGKLHHPTWLWNREMKTWWTLMGQQKRQGKTKDLEVWKMMIGLNRTVWINIAWINIAWG